jgi:flagella basal body P-ring formation protein FlgA
VIARTALLLLACTTPLVAQSRATVDSLVAQITQRWGTPPRGGWCAEWAVVRGDSTALHVSTAEISGSDRSGMYTVTVRPAKFAAPVLVGRLRIGHEREEPVTARSVERGAVLRDQDLLQQHSLVWGAPDTTPSLSIAALIGATTRRVLRSGETVRSIDITAAPVVFAGDTVHAEFIRDGVRLALVGTALQNASLGGRVAIRLDRGRRFAGIAIGRNTVRLD